MKPDWDQSSPQLGQNLGQALASAETHARARRPVSLALMKDWHGRIMAGLKMRNGAWAGCFRGDGAAKHIGVGIGAHVGTAPEKVGEELQRFERRLLRAVAVLDAAIGPDGADTIDDLRAVVDLCAWVHGEWIRIHPFVNGSGRTARLWVNYLAMRYGLPPFARLRPRPDSGYGAAAGASMAGDWKAMIPVFHLLLSDALDL